MLMAVTRFSKEAMLALVRQVHQQSLMLMEMRRFLLKLIFRGTRLFWAMSGSVRKIHQENFMLPTVTRFSKEAMSVLVRKVHQRNFMLTAEMRFFLAISILVKLQDR